MSGDRARGERRDVVVVGGGPAGAATAIQLARRGRDVLLLERAPAWRWRACGVFTSPATIDALRQIGLDEDDLSKVVRRVPAMRVETTAGTTFRLTYGDDGSLAHAAAGLDRSRLDPLLLEHAAAAGVEVRRGADVRSVRDGLAMLADGAAVEARVIVGADGLRSVVARDGRVVAAPPFGGRPALTFHVADPGGDRPRDARMVVLDGAYVGLAPVPGGRVNVGIVLISPVWRERLRTLAAAETARAVLAAIRAADDDPVDWSTPTICDAIEGASPVGLRVTRRAGSSWLLVGDAAGFLDPFTGEGLGRALRTAELAAAAVDRHLEGDAMALRRYDRALRRRFLAKDSVSAVVQAFVARPGAFEYVARRLAARSDVRETMGRVIGDLGPATAAFDPRLLVGLLRP
ncbi:MAG TPA: NAD(P)/FAD-dependent oxidoreductase [Candidatus Limnocylindrales bacterium]|nr:NAD(P)/FAD-dependent oxidoreductase [Candidatus Limnocylindrales bacterium]